MANASVMAGLGAGLGLLGQGIMDKEKEDREDARAERKAQLTAKLAIQVNQAKQEFMKANPRFTQHVTTASGDLYGISQTGDIKLLHGASDEEKAIGQQTRDNNAAYKTAQAASLMGNMSLLAPKAELMGSQIAVNQSRSNRLDNPIPKTGGKSSNIITPAQMDKLVDDQVKRSTSEIDMKTMEPSEMQAKREAAKQTIMGQGYTVGFQNGGLAAPNPVSNDFMDLVGGQSGDIPDPEEDSYDPNQ